MSLGSSPLVYLRCSLNSTEKPWNGLACSPCKKPFTTNWARMSSRLIWLMTSGLRYFSTDTDLIVARSLRERACRHAECAGYYVLLLTQIGPRVLQAGAEN